MAAWVDSSVLIALQKAGDLDFLRRYLRRVHVTAAVRDEVLTGKETAELRAAFDSWIAVEAVSGDPRRYRALGLSAGEASLLLTPAEDILVIDELTGREVARSEGRRVTGLLGLLVAAKRDRVLSQEEAAALLGRLRDTGFHIATDLYEAVQAELRG